MASRTAKTFDDKGKDRDAEDCFRVDLSNAPPSSFNRFNSSAALLKSSSFWEPDRLERLMQIEARKPWISKVSSTVPALKAPEEMKAMKASVRAYYESQAEMITWMEERYLHDHPINEAEKKVNEEEDREEHLGRLATFAISASFSLNVVLAVLKLVALIISGSIAVLASLVDSLLDILSGMVLFLTRRAIDRTDPYKWPQGKRRLEPVGVLVFSVVMSVASLQIIRESLDRLASGLTGEPVALNFSLLVKLIVGFTICSKVFMCAFCYYVAARTGSSSVKAYAMDHRNDVLSNAVGMGGLAAAVTMPRIWFMDPVVAILISVFILVTWVNTGLLHMNQVVGHAADHNFIRKITFLALNHDERVVAVDTTRAYHFGEQFLVEVDIVLPAETPLVEAHDIGESLQIKIEELAEVERAFVHLDTEYLHKPEHKKTS